MKRQLYTLHGSLPWLPANAQHRLLNIEAPKSGITALWTYYIRTDQNGTLQQAYRVVSDTELVYTLQHSNAILMPCSGAEEMCRRLLTFLQTQEPADAPAEPIPSFLRMANEADLRFLMQL